MQIDPVLVIPFFEISLTVQFICSIWIFGTIILFFIHYSNFRGIGRIEKAFLLLSISQYSWWTSIFSVSTGYWANCNWIALHLLKDYSYLTCSTMYHLDRGFLAAIICLRLLINWSKAAIAQQEAKKYLHSL